MQVRGIEFNVILVCYMHGLSYLHTYIEEGYNPPFVKHNNVVYVERLIYLILSPSRKS